MYYPQKLWKFTYYLLVWLQVPYRASFPLHAAFSGWITVDPPPTPRSLGFLNWWRGFQTHLGSALPLSTEGHQPTLPAFTLEQETQGRGMWARHRQASRPCCWAFREFGSKEEVVGLFALPNAQIVWGKVLKLSPHSQLDILPLCS